MYFGGDARASLSPLSVGVGGNFSRRKKKNKQTKMEWLVLLWVWIIGLASAQRRCAVQERLCLHTRIHAGYVCGKGPENAAIISSSGEAAPREAGARRELASTKESRGC